MPSNTVAQFALELKMPANALLEQLQAAGVDIKSVDDPVTDADKAKLLESLRRAHGASDGHKITLTRRQTSEIRQADGSGRSRTIPVEVRKKRVFVKRDPRELAAEAARAAEQARAEAEADAQVAKPAAQPETRYVSGADACAKVDAPEAQAPAPPAPQETQSKAQEQVQEVAQAPAQETPEPAKAAAPEAPSVPETPAVKAEAPAEDKPQAQEPAVAEQPAEPTAVVESAAEQAKQEAPAA